MKTLREIIKNSVIQFAEKNAFFDINKFGKKVGIKYSEVGDRVEKISYYLSNKLKIKKGASVALYSENRMDWVLAYMSILNIGAVVVPIDAKYKRNELDFLIKDSKSKTIFVSSDLLSELMEADDALSHLKNIISFDEVIEKKVISFDEIIAKTEVKNNWDKKINIVENDLAVLIYTSGTTGTAKGVMLSHKNIVSNIKSIHYVDMIFTNDRMLSVLPLHHTFEATAGMWTPFFVGAAAYYLLIVTPKLIMKTIEKEKINKMVVVPLLIQKIYQNIVREIEKKKNVRRLFVLLKFIANLLYKIKKDDKIYNRMFRFLRKKAGLGSIEFFISGAAPLQEIVAEGMKKFGFNIFQGYGLTEASPVISTNIYGSLNNKSVGVPLHGVSVKIVDADENGIGEIVAKGDNVMVGYYKNRIETDKVLIDGWLYTGDVGYLDKDGFIFITGREKNIIVTNGGKNIFPEEIEEKILEHTVVGEIAIIGKKISENDNGETPFAFIVPNMDEIEFKYGNIDQTRIEKLIDDIIKEVNLKLPMYKRIKDYKILYEELPKTSTRKVKRFLLKNIAGF